MIQFFQNIGNFFGTIFGNWQGLLIGLAVAIVFCLVLAVTAFKNNGGATKVFTPIFLIIFSISGAFIQKQFFTFNSFQLPTAADVIANVQLLMKDNYKNTNGFSREQVIDAMKEDNCPTSSDELMEFYIQDYGDYVCVYYREKPNSVMPIYNHYNVTFIKSDYGLINDGVLNVSGRFPVVNTGFLAYQIDYGNIEWNIDYLSIPSYEEADLFHLTHGYKKVNNLVSISDTSAKYIAHLYNWVDKGHENLAYYANKEAQKLHSENMMNNHISWDNNVELAGLADTVYSDINTFYTYLYNAVKDTEYGTVKYVDSQGYLCKTIPAEERINYPVSDTFKEKYPDTDYYSVYDCNIGIKLTYLEGNKTLYGGERLDEVVEENKDKIAEKIQTPQEIYSLTCNFEDVSTSKHGDIDLSSAPITFTFTNTVTNTTHTLLITDEEQLSNKNVVVFKELGTYSYTISSDKVIFPSNSGTFTLSQSNSNIVFDYEYYDDYVPFFIALTALDSFDSSTIDLTSTPIKITLTNSEYGVFEYSFTSLGKGYTYMQNSLPIGVYDYVITSTSAYVSFAQTTGVLTVSAANTFYQFHYGVSSDLINSVMVINGNVAPALDILTISDNIFDEYITNSSLNKGSVWLYVYDAETNERVAAVYLSLNEKFSEYDISSSLSSLDYGKDYVILSHICQNSGTKILVSNTVTVTRSKTMGWAIDISLSSES